MNNQTAVPTNVRIRAMNTPSTMLKPTTDADTILATLAAFQTSQELTPAEMIQRKLQLIESVLDVSHVCVCQVNTTEFQIMYSQGVWERVLKVGTNLAIQDTLVEYVIQANLPIVIADTTNDIRANRIQEIIALPTTAYIGTRLCNSDGTVYGILAAIDAGARHFSQAQVNLVQMIANEIAYIIERENKLRSVLQAVEAADDDLGATLVVLDRQQTLLRIVAHDLRTPLTAIFTGSSALLQGLFGPIDQSKQRVVDLMDKSSRYMNRLINDLMDASVAEDPMLALVPEKFDAIEMANELLAICQSRVQEAGLWLNLEVEGDDLIVLGDRERLMQALVNLLNNAIAYTNVGGVTLRLIGAEEHIGFEVVDTGPGIASADLDRIWDPHVRATSKGKGLGLGLYVVALLATRMGGETGVNSTEGEGSTFWFRLPRNNVRMASAHTSPIPEDSDE